MIASLPMYDWPEIQTYNDKFWEILKENLSPFCDHVPKELNRSMPLYDQWQHDDLFLSQTCAYPLVTQLPKTAVIVGTPIYDVEHCSDGNYASVLLVRKNDLRTELSEFKNSVLAYNSLNSQSGFNTLRSLLLEKEYISEKQSTFFSPSVQSGSHRKSIELVASGKADICAIDPVSWGLAQRYDEQTKDLRILTLTNQTPALPLVTNASSIPGKFNEEEWRNLVMRAFEKSIDETVSNNLLISGIVFKPLSDYLKLPICNLDMIN